MKIERRFTRAGADAYAEVDFTTTSSEIRNPNGTIVFRLDEVEVPTGWSQVASDVIAQKYFRKAGVPAALKPVKRSGVPDFLWRHVADEKALEEMPEDQRYGGETSAKQVFDAWPAPGPTGAGRAATSPPKRTPAPISTKCADAGAPDGGAEQPAMVQHRPALGLWHRRAEPGPLLRRLQDGQADQIEAAYEHPQPHACFIQSVADDLVNDGGIMDLWVREARLFKYGSGTGTNFSSLRAEGEKLSGGGKSSGLMGFLKIGDRAAGAIKSGGTTRRAAKMVIVDADHPDIEEFINWKVKEEQKVASLVAGSKMHEKMLNGIFDAIRAWDGAEATMRSIRRNEALKKAIRAAKQVAIPETYVKRVLDYARRAMPRSSSRPMTPIGTARPMPRSPARTPTTPSA
jgi:ribonucleoside-diphosphate reductase alpha chain